MLFKSKYESLCSNCHDPVKVGDVIQHTERKAVVVGWFDFGIRKGETKYAVASYKHVECEGVVRTRFGRVVKRDR